MTSAVSMLGRLCSAVRVPVLFLVPQDIEVKEVRKMLNDCMRDLGAVQKKVAILEGEMEQQKHERHQILKACKVRQPVSHDCVFASLPVYQSQV